MEAPFVAGIPSLASQMFLNENETGQYIAIVSQETYTKVEQIWLIIETVRRILIEQSNYSNRTSIIKCKRLP